MRRRLGVRNIDATLPLYFDADSDHRRDVSGRDRLVSHLLKVAHKIVRRAHTEQLAHCSAGWPISFAGADRRNPDCRRQLSASRRLTPENKPHRQTARIT